MLILSSTCTLHVKVKENIQDALAVANRSHEGCERGNGFTAERVYVITIRSSSRDFVAVRYL